MGVAAAALAALDVVLERRVVARDLDDRAQRRRGQARAAEVRVDDDAGGVDDRAQRRPHARLGATDRIRGEAVGVEGDGLAGQDGGAHRLDRVTDGVDHHRPREHLLQRGEVLALEQFVGLGKRAQKRLLVHG